MRKTIFTQFFLWCMVVFFTFTTFAQNNSSLHSFTAESNNSSSPPVIEGGGALLWDNFLTQSTTAIVSDEWGGLPAGANQTICADDFVVTSGDIWTIDQIAATGFYSAGSFEVDSWGVGFYADAGGIPGAFIASATVAVVPGDPNPAGLLSTPVVLSNGTYWVAVYGINDTSTDIATFRWNWYTSEDPGVGFEPHLIDLAGWFGGLPWTSFTGLGLIPPFNNLMFQLYGTTAPIPVELTSFAATVNENDVVLNWSTATETNNMGFEVQRSSNGSDYSRISFIEGHGTVTETQNYTYSDKNVEVGTYTYRLKQIDFDGTSELSDAVEVEVIAPEVYALEQNYPNPFNPSTQINFSLAVDSKVSLTVFDVLGQELASLINGNLAAGSHELNFNASNLNSGVYFYRIDAAGVDGTNFSSVKKMILTK